MTRHELEGWLRRKLAARLHVSPDAVDVNRPVDELGIDSVEALGLTGELEVLLGRRINPTSVWDHRTVVGLAKFLTGEADELATSEMTRGMSDDEVDSLLRKMAGGMQ